MAEPAVTPRPVIVLSDGLGGMDYEGHGYLVAALCASEEAWMDSGIEEIGYADTVAVNSDDSVRQVVMDAVDSVRVR